MGIRAAADGMSRLHALSGRGTASRFETPPPQATPPVDTATISAGATEKKTPAPLDMVKNLQGTGRFYTRRLYVWKQTHDAPETLDKLSRGEPVSYARDGREMQIESADELPLLYQLEGENTRTAPELLPLKGLARGLHDDDGLFLNGRPVTAFQALQAMRRHERVRVEAGPVQQEIETPQAAAPVYEQALHALPVPLAGHHEKDAPLTWRRASIDDAESVKAVYNLAFDRDTGWTESCFADTLRSSDKNAVMVSGPEGVVGMYITGHDRIRRDSLNIDFVSVTPAAQGKHVGDALFLHLLQEARGNGDDRCYLEVDATNTRAQALYQKCGFEKIEILPDYYWRGRDGWLMELRGLQSEEAGRRLDEIARQDAPFPSARMQTAAPTGFATVGA